MMKTDSPDASRKGNLYIDQHDNPLIVDGVAGYDGGDEASISHYHWTPLSAAGKTSEASDTVPGDEDTRWMTVATFEDRLESGELRPATVTVKSELYTARNLADDARSLRLDAKGRVTIPKDVREEWGVEHGDNVDVAVIGADKDGYQCDKCRDHYPAPEVLRGERTLCVACLDVEDRLVSQPDVQL